MTLVQKVVKRLILITAMLLGISGLGQVAPTVPVPNYHVPGYPVYGDIRTPPGGWYNQTGCSLPTLPVFCDVTVNIPGTNIICPVDGVSDCSKAINAAMARCPSGNIVKIPSGFYVLTNSVVWGSSYTYLIGAGSFGNNTTEFYFVPNGVTTGNQSATVFGINSSKPAQFSASNTMVGSFEMGATTFSTVFNNGPGAGVGGYSNILYNDGKFTPGWPDMIVSISQENVLQVVQGGVVSTNGFFGESDYNSPHFNMAQMIHVNLTNQVNPLVTNVAANTVTFTPDKPSLWWWDTTNKPYINLVQKPIVGCMLANCLIHFALTNQAVTGGAVQCLSGYRCVVSNVVIQNFPQDGIRFEMCLNCEADWCILDRATHSASGQGYTDHYFGPCTDCRFHAIFNYSGRHAFIAEGPLMRCVWDASESEGYGEPAQGSDAGSPGFVYDEALYHAAHPVFCLRELLKCAKLAADVTHGSTSQDTDYRCRGYGGATNTSGIPSNLAAATNYNLALINGGLNGLWNAIPYTGGNWCLTYESSNIFMNTIACVLGFSPGSAATGVAQWAHNGANWQEGRLGFSTVATGGESGTLSGDLSPSNTLYFNQNISLFLGGSGSIASWSNTMALPASLLYAVGVTPPDWSNNIPYPSIGPDVTETIAGPATLNYVAVATNTDGTTGPIASLPVTEWFYGYTNSYEWTIGGGGGGGGVASVYATGQRRTH